MPSPLAHCSLAIVAWPSLHAAAAPRWRRWTLLALLLGALIAPDADILLDPILGRPLFATHGGPMHSLAAGVLFAPVFVLAARLIVTAPALRLAVIGLLAYWSHVLLDACTLGRGVMVLWPLSSERFAMPVPLFFGVRHGDWGAWRLHGITLGTEAIFAGAVWLAMRVRPRAAGGGREGAAMADRSSLKGAMR